MQRVRRAVHRVDALLTLQRVYYYPLLVLIVLIGALILRRGFGFGVYEPLAMSMDFTARYTGGLIVLHGDIAKLYDLQHQWTVQQEVIGTGFENYLNAFVSPPFLAYLYVPFAAMPFPAAAAVMAATNIVLLIVSVRLLWPLVPNIHHYRLGRVLVVFFSSGAALMLLEGGQDAALTMLIFVAGLRLLLARHDALAGVILGLGVFKPHLFILVPVLLLLQRRWRAMAAWMAVAGLLTALSVVLVGMKGIYTLFQIITSPGFTAGQTAASHKMVSLMGLLGSLMPEPFALGIIAVAAGILAAGYWHIAARSTSNARHFALLYGAFILMNFIINPHLYLYDSVILLIPALILLNDAPTHPAIRVSLVVAYMCMFFRVVHYGTFGIVPWTVFPVIALLIVTRQRLMQVDEKGEIDDTETLDIEPGRSFVSRKVAV